jgi:hypothetical protein
LIIKSKVTSYTRIATIGSKLDHIKSIIITTTTSDNKVAVTRGESNLSTKNYVVVNRGIIKATIDSVFNGDLDSALISSIGRTHCSIDIADY